MVDDSMHSALYSMLNVRPIVILCANETVFYTYVSFMVSILIIYIYIQAYMIYIIVIVFKITIKKRAERNAGREGYNLQTSLSH